VESFAPAGPFAAPVSAGSDRPGRKVLRIYPYAVSRNRLERAIRELRVPAYITDHLEDADLVLTIKSQEKRQPKRLRDAQSRGMPMHVVKSNTVTQLENFLRSVFDVGDYLDDQEAALREVEDAIREVLDDAQPVELSPQNSYVRRLQHQLVQRYGLSSESKGEEPYRRVVIYPR
jgi:protein-tyrosine-phosphatase